ncbi:MAG TPA: alpha/beta hydrolase [Candidatus Borkfalkia excrementigallinarum]|uniref:Alpha/beta hydrolase n=1 Tax=Candidatus Borkfalkia excrementigallinarum TaxID=2838506 RepID=A0A9D1ZY56_9FIRM|nr:alpha/beta hydrolase [Candidatus Borkfalkia excrementigallinarum]
MKKYAVDVCEDVILNGNRQNIRIRASREGLPVILFLHGGPGVCDRHFVLENQSQIAENYTMVCWDQRGSGKSYSPDIKRQELSIEKYVDDAESLIDLLRGRFHADKVIVAGHSWGTVLGTKLAVRCPEKIAAYVAQGMFIDGSENELESYLFCVREAERTGNKKAVRQLSGIRPENGRYPSDKAMMIQRNYLSKFGGGTYKKREGMFRSLLVPLLKSREYKLSDISRYAKGGLYLSKVLWNDVVAVSFKDITELKVPLIVTQGRHDYNTPSSIAENWYSRLQAPFKKWVWFEESAHSPIFEEPEKWGKEVLLALSEALGGAEVAERQTSGFDK